MRDGEPYHLWMIKKMKEDPTNLSPATGKGGLGVLPLVEWGA